MRGHVNKLQPSGSKYGIMIIGINPSERSTLEDVWKDKFGKDLLRYLNEAGIDEDDLWMTNLWKYTTEGNAPLNEVQLGIGMEEIREEIQDVLPSAIILMGQQVYTQFGITGPFQSSMLEDFPIYSVPHVAYLSRVGNPDLEKRFISFLKDIHDKERFC